MDPGLIEEVIDACGLRPDLNMWPDGIEYVKLLHPGLHDDFRSNIGEKGITLSGGQRQRICLARAAYSKSSKVVLLDDVLSAVDANVCNHILQHCILSGPLAHQTRILVTHHLDVLPSADWILVMDKDDNNEGHIIQKGTYEVSQMNMGT